MALDGSIHTTDEIHCIAISPQALTTNLEERPKEKGQFSVTSLGAGGLQSAKSRL